MPDTVVQLEVQVVLQRDAEVVLQERGQDAGVADRRDEQEGQRDAAEVGRAPRPPAMTSWRRKLLRLVTTA